jgi:mannose-6-phosphate isomerase-like protein (cupin superfamily)
MTEGKAWGKTEEIFSAGALSIHHLEIQAGGFSSEHRHRAKNNWFYILAGKLAITIWQPSSKADLTVLEVGQSTRIPAGAWHQFKALTDVQALELYWTELDTADIERRSEGGQERPQ